jgi:hypothetical protein
MSNDLQIDQEIIDRGNKQTNIFKEDSDHPANILYQSRQNYKLDATSWVAPIYQPVLIDQTTERPFYGRTDSQGNAIFPSERFLKQITPTNNSIYMAHDFVKDSFSKMRDYYTKGINSLPVANSEGPYNDLRSQKAFISVHKIYSDFLNDTSQNFANYIHKFSKNKVATFDDLLDEFLYFLRDTERNVTRSKFILSDACDPFTGGFSIALANADTNKDYEKYETYIKDPNFSFFLDCCLRFGFSVDKYIPWNIHYNFSYGDFKRTIQQSYGAQDYEDLIQKRFYKAFYTDIKILKDFLLYLYNISVVNNQILLVDVDINKCQNAVASEISREQLTREYINSKYDDKFWLKYYLQIRMHEEAIVISEARFKELILNINNLSNYSGFIKALEYLNTFILQNKKPIDLQHLKTY